MHELIRANHRRAAVLAVGMALLMVMVGYAFAEYAVGGAGPVGVVLALCVWAVQAAVSYFGGKRILLSMSGARRIEKSDHPILFNIVEEMCVASGTPKMPEVYIIDDDALNAFATGRDPDDAAVAVTAGLLKELDRDELQGVIAHEISHVRNRDVLYMTMLSVMMATILLFAEIGIRMRGGTRTRTSGSRNRDSGGGAIIVLAVLLLVLAPFLARLLYLAVSRKREYLADACGALYTRYPEGLARALEKLGGSRVTMQNASAAVAPMYIVAPLKAAGRKLEALGSTHPPLQERVRILRSMGGSAGVRSYDDAFRKVTGRPVGVVPFAALREAPEVSVKAPPAAATAPFGPATGPLGGATAPLGAASAPLGAAAAPLAAAAAPLTHIERVRHTTDLLWAMNDYIFIACPCETRLKIPPAYRGKKIECPHCSRVHHAV